jgi:hypothetical protein
MAKQWPEVEMRGGKPHDKWVTTEELADLEDRHRATYAALRYTPACRVSRLPGVLDNRKSNNVLTQTQDPIATIWSAAAGAYVQAAVWSNHQRRVIVGIRTLPDGRWTTADLYAISGLTYFTNRIVEFDEHNGLTVTFDGDGYLHVAGNMHGDFLTYARSTAPFSVTGWETPGMLGSSNNDVTPMRDDEKLVSYPRFVRLADGDLLFTYRNGASGNGDQYLNRYDTATKTWSRVATLLLGSTATPTPESAYVNHIAYRDGRIGLSWTWRPNGGGTADTHDLSFAYSDDDGATWNNAAGASQTLPFTPADTGCVVLAGTQGGSLDVGAGCDLDRLGRPHLVTKSNPSGLASRWQMKHLWWDGAAWQSQQITNWIEEYKAQNPRPQLFVTDSGRVYVLVTWFLDGWRDGHRLIDCTPGDVPQAFKLTDLPTRNAVALFDTAALRETNTLHLFVSPSSDFSPPSLPELWAEDNWQAQYGLVLSFDCSQLEQIQSGRALRPRIRSITSGGLPQGTSITTAPGTPAAFGPVTGVPAGAQISGSMAVLTAPEYRGRIVLARLSASAVVASSGQIGVVQLGNAQDGGTAYLLATLPFTLTSTATKVTPWVPLVQGPAADDSTLDGRLVIFGSVQSLTHTVTISGSPTGGTFRLTYGGRSTGNLAYNASAADVQAALRALTSVAGVNNSTGDVNVTGAVGGPYSVVFGSAVAVPGSALTATSIALTGGSGPTVSVSNAGGTETFRSIVVEYGVIEV